MATMKRPRRQVKWERKSPGAYPGFMHQAFREAIARPTIWHTMWVYPSEKEADNARRVCKFLIDRYAEFPLYAPDIVKALKDDGGQIFMFRIVTGNQLQVMLSPDPKNIGLLGQNVLRER